MSEQTAQLRDQQGRYQTKMSTKRSLIDSLSSKMATLVKHQNELRAKQMKVEDSIQTLSRNLNQLKYLS